MNHVTESGYLPITGLIAALINVAGSNNKIKMIEVAVPVADDDYFTNNHLVDDPEQIFRSLIEIDGDGDPAIRYGKYTTSGSNKLAKAELDSVQMLRSCIGKTSDGKPFIRLAMEAL